MEIKLSIKRAPVEEEVAKTTAYTGAKAVGDENSWERISTTEEDLKALGRFWDESVSALCGKLKGTLSGMTEDEKGLDLTLDVSGAFDMTLLPSVRNGIYSYLAQSITAKWYVYTNKAEAADYMAGATALLNDVHSKLLFKKRPTRPTYS